MIIAVRQTKNNCECIPNLDKILTIRTNQLLNISVLYNASLINCRSVVNKTADLKVELADCNLHVCALTETWLKEGNDITPNQLCLNGYSIASVPRVNRTQGGIALIHKLDITLKAKSVYSYTSMECVDCALCFPTTLINLCIIYWPPNTSVLDFCNDLTDYFEKNITSPGSKIIVGDFNIPINQDKHPDTIIFKDTLDGLNLFDHVNFDTNHMGNRLDTILTTQETTLNSNTKQGCLFSSGLT